MAPPKDLIAEFILRYRREFDFYEQAGRMAAIRLEARLESSGIRAIVTTRAKNPKRLEAKIRARYQDKQYATVDDIYADIVDLVGVRVALYFPGERDEVQRIIEDSFRLAAIPKFFTGTGNTEPTSKKRFSGYWAAHYRIHLKEDSLAEQSIRFSDALIEIQVASVLMHAWSEVEHDLVYKPLQGSLSEDELAILDQLNGMVLTGEIALERLQKAAKTRLSSEGAEFENHYDLASFLLEKAKLKMVDVKTEPVVGDIETLYRLMQRINKKTAASLVEYIDAMVPDDEKRPLAEQIIDRIIATHPDRYMAYADIRQDSYINESEASPKLSNNATENSWQEAVGKFMMEWITFEKFIRAISSAPNRKSLSFISAWRPLVERGIINQADAAQIERIRRIRNDLVHGLYPTSEDSLQVEAGVLSNLLEKFKMSTDQDVAQSMQTALTSADLMNVKDLYAGLPRQARSRGISFTLSSDAVELLTTAASDQQGQIFKVVFLSGRLIQAGGKSFGEESAREFARWDSALNELLAERYIEVRGHKGELFVLTKDGWDYVDAAQKGLADEGT